MFMKPGLASNGAAAPWALLPKPLAVLSLLHSGAIFGFFYAWVCSTMWGLDAADPDVAISAMQAMNASVRNPIFAQAFFGTPLLLLAAALVAWNGKERRAALFFGSSGLLYVVLRGSGETTRSRGSSGMHFVRWPPASFCYSPDWVS